MADHFAEPVENDEQTEREVDFSYLKDYLDTLLCAEALRPEVDRQVRVFAPSERSARFQLPDEFYGISADELKKEQKLRQEAVEKMGMLMTKEMRERERQRQLHQYRYCLIRVRFPDGLILQAVFRSSDKVSELFDVVKDSLAIDYIPYSLMTATDGSLEKLQSQTFAEASLAPASVIHFNWDREVYEDVLRESQALPYALKRQLMSKLEVLP